LKGKQDKMATRADTIQIDRDKGRG